MEQVKSAFYEITGNKYKIIVSAGLGWAVQKFALVTKLLSLL